MGHQTQVFSLKYRRIRAQVLVFHPLSHLPRVRVAFPPALGKMCILSTPFRRGETYVFNSLESIREENPDKGGPLFFLLPVSPSLLPTVHLPGADGRPRRQLFQEYIPVFALIMITSHFICLSKSRETLLGCLFIPYTGNTGRGDVTFSICVTKLGAGAKAHGLR